MKAQQENEYIILLVNESIPKYGVSGYRGTSINGAIKEYYSFTTNCEKVAVLKWIVAQPQFVELKRFAEAENKIFTLNESEYDDILKTGETPKNLQIAQKFVKNKFDVFLLSNPSNTKSADFIIRQKGKLFYVEGKTLNGKNSLNHLIEKGGMQSNRIAINVVGTTVTNYIKETIKKSFEQNKGLVVLYLFKGQRCLTVDRDVVYSKDFEKNFTRLWNKQK